MVRLARWSTLAVTLAAAACATEPTTYLLGTFGGQHLELTAFDSSAVLRFPCGVGRLSALRVTALGEFGGSGQYRCTGAGCDTEPISLAGRLTDPGSISVTVLVGAEVRPQPITVVLRRDVPGDFAGIGCLAASRTAPPN
jgi:hypothetical protein